MAGNGERHNRAAIGGIHRAHQADTGNFPQTGQQLLKQGQLMTADCLSADPLNIGDPGPQAGNSRRIQRAALKALRRFQWLVKISRTAARTTYQQRFQMCPFADIEETGPGGTVQSLMSRRRQQINRHLINPQRKRTGTLRCINQKQDITAAANCPNLFYRLNGAGYIGTVGNCHQTRFRPQCLRHLLRGNTASPIPLQPRHLNAPRGSQMQWPSQPRRRT